VVGLGAAMTTVDNVAAMATNTVVILTILVDGGQLYATSDMKVYRKECIVESVWKVWNV
jgi:hypothetical protein